MKRIIIFILLLTPLLAINNNVKANTDVSNNVVISGDQLFIDELNIVINDFVSNNGASIRFNRDVTHSSFEGMEAILDTSNYNVVHKGLDSKTELYEANTVKFKANNKKVDVYIDDFLIEDVSSRDHSFSLLNQNMIMVRFYEMEYYNSASWARNIKYIEEGSAIGELDPTAFKKKPNYDNVIYSDVELTNEIDTNYIPTTKTFDVYHQYEFIENTVITLTYDAAGGDLIPSVDIELTSGEGIKVQDLGFELPTPTKPGFDFEYWEIQDEYDRWGRITPYTVLNTDTVIRASYREVKSEYRVTYFPLLGEHDHTDEYWGIYKFSGLTLIVNRGETVVKKTGPVKGSNYQELFIGWSTNRYEYVEYDFNTPIEKHTNLYAHYEKIDRATINYVTNGGYLLDEQVRYPFNVDIEYDIPEKSRNAFDGWYLDQAFTIKAPTVLDWSDTSTHEMTLYAKWIDNSGTLFFETNGGSEISPIVIQIGQRVVLPTYPPKRQGYTFKGWYLDGQLTRLVPDFFEFEGTTTIHAGWERNENEDIETVESDNMVLYIVIGSAALGFVLLASNRKKW